MIITNNEEALRIKCEDVLPDEVGELVATLERELEYSARIGNPGIGLAAPQCGIGKKIAIVRIDDIKLNLVNAELDQKFDLQMFRNEGCLSFPGRIEDTMRYQEITVKNNLIFPKKFVATGLVSVVIQHELDHINGILLPDNVIKKNIKMKPNELCFCGSNIKYKKCHGRIK